MRIGIVGSGTIGQIHAKAATATGVEVEWIADVDPERAARLADQWDARSTTDPQEILRDARVDAVVVAVPNVFHKQLAIDAVRAGKDVLLEKPMALNAAECGEINDAVRESGKLLQVAYVQRFSAVGEAARQIAEAGELGDIYHAKAHMYRRRGVPGLGRWFTNRALSGGGALVDIGVHLLDLSLHVLGHPRPQRVSGSVYTHFGSRMQDYVYEEMWAGPPDYTGVCDVEDSAHAFIGLEGEASLDLNVSWAGNFPESLFPPSMLGFFGTKAGMTFQFFGENVQLSLERFGRNVDETIRLTASDPYERQMEKFAESVATRQVLGSTGEQAERVQSIVDAIYASSEQRREITLA